MFAHGFAINLCRWSDEQTGERSRMVAGTWTARTSDWRTESCRTDLGCWPPASSSPDAASAASRFESSLPPARSRISWSWWCSGNRGSGTSESARCRPGKRPRNGTGTTQLGAWDRCSPRDNSGSLTRGWSVLSHSRSGLLARAVCSSSSAPRRTTCSSRPRSLRNWQPASFANRDCHRASQAASLPPSASHRLP